ncbi:MAG: hypothetical protein AB7K09_19120 [Planctomycetota bacterium]
MQRALSAAVLLVALAAPAFAQQPAPEPAPAPDTVAVNFFTPGHFKAAVAAATQQKRLLLIKGIAFGVDELGAQCATKGHW